MTVEKAPAMPLYVKDIYTDERVVVLSFAAQGFYIRLLGHQWLEGSIPASISALEAITGKAESKKLWPLISQFFSPHPTLEGRLQNAKLERVRSDLARFRERKSSAGAHGAASRWGRDKSANGSAMSGATDVTLTSALPASPVPPSPPGDSPLTPRSAGGRRKTKAETEANVGGREVPDDVAREERRGDYASMQKAVAEWEATHGVIETIDQIREFQRETRVGWGAYLELRDEFSDADLSPPLQLIHATTH